METVPGKSAYLGSSDLTLADIAAIPYVNRCDVLGLIPLWQDRGRGSPIGPRPAANRGLPARLASAGRYGAVGARSPPRSEPRSASTSSRPEDALMATTSAYRSVRTVFRKASHQQTSMFVA
jgi:hypothetical protein